MIPRRYKLNELQVKVVSDCAYEICRVCDHKKVCNNISGCNLFSILHFVSMTKVEPFIQEKYVEENNKEIEFEFRRPIKNPFGKPDK